MVTEHRGQPAPDDRLPVVGRVRRAGERPQHDEILDPVLGHPRALLADGVQDEVEAGGEAVGGALPVALDGDERAGRGGARSRAAWAWPDVVADAGADGAGLAVGCAERRARRGGGERRHHHDHDGGRQHPVSGATSEHGSPFTMASTLRQNLGNPIHTSRPRRAARGSRRQPARRGRSCAMGGPIVDAATRRPPDADLLPPQPPRPELPDLLQGAGRGDAPRRVPRRPDRAARPAGGSSGAGTAGRGAGDAVSAPRGPRAGSPCAGCHAPPRMAFAPRSCPGCARAPTPSAWPRSWPSRRPGCERLQADPPGLYAEVADASRPIEERTWLAFLIAYLGPVDDAEPFAGIAQARTPWARASRPTSTASRPGPGPPTSPSGASGRSTPTARGPSAAGSQEAAFTGDAAWTPERRFARVFERLALPGLHRGRTL